MVSRFILHYVPKWNPVCLDWSSLFLTVLSSHYCSRTSLWAQAFMKMPTKSALVPARSDTWLLPTAVNVLGPSVLILLLSGINWGRLLSKNLDTSTIAISTPPPPPTCTHTHTHTKQLTYPLPVLSLVTVYVRLLLSLHFIFFFIFLHMHLYPPSCTTCPDITIMVDWA